MWIVAAAVIGSLFAGPRASGAPGAPVGVGDPAPALAPKDVMDRAVDVPAKGKVTLLSFVSKSNGEKAGEITRAVRVEHPDVEMVAFVDLSGFPGFLRGTIRGKIKARQPGVVKDQREAFAKAGKTPPTDLAERVHVVPDFDAAFCKAYGATETGAHPRFVVVGADGKVAAVVDGLERETVSAEIAKALEGS